MKKIVVVALAVLLSHSVAFATIATDVLNVTAQISTGAGECTVSTSPIDFGTSDGTVGVEAQGEITVQCPLDLPYTIALDAGQSYDGYNRALMGPTALLAYYLLAPDNNAWGDDNLTHWAPSFSRLGLGTPETLPVSGNTDPGYYGTPPDGIYSDVVTVTVNY